MRLRTIAVAAAVGLIASLAPATAAEAAKRPAYEVSIKIGKTRADVGQVITVAGRVKGPKAKKKRLVLQRKVGAGKWRAVKKVRTNKRGRYTTKVKVNLAGQQYLRVVAPKSKKARAGVSLRRGYVGWRWLDLTTQRSAHSGITPVTGSAVIAGRTYPKTMTFSRTAVGFNTAVSCTTFKGSLGVKDGDTTAADLDYGTFTTTAGTDEPVVQNVSAAPGVAPVPLRMSLTGTRLLAFDAYPGTATVVAPAARCKVNALPTAVMPF